MALIATTESSKKKPLFRDNSPDLTAPELALVQSAMSLGLTEFTIPTPADDHQRTDWRVKTWLGMRSGEPVAYLVAYQVLNPHFEVVGPELDSDGQPVKTATSKPNGLKELQKR